MEYTISKWTSSCGGPAVTVDGSDHLHQSFQGGGCETSSSTGVAKELGSVGMTREVEFQPSFRGGKFDLLKRSCTTLAPASLVGGPYSQRTAETWYQ